MVVVKKTAVIKIGVDVTVVAAVGVAVVVVARPLCCSTGMSAERC
jgi:hypothetical protein